MVTNQFSDFTDYQEEPIQIDGAGGTTTSPGFGTVELKLTLTNGTTREIQLSNVRYMPQCPVKWFSLKKIMIAGGSLHSNRIMFFDEGIYLELCEVDNSGFLVESRLCQTGIYFDALVSAANKASIDTWHRRFAHTSKNNIIRTKNMVDGVNFDTSNEEEQSVCKACELGAPLEHKRKSVRNKSSNALARIHVDTFMLQPEGFNGEKYGMILTDEATSERWGYKFSTKNSAYGCLKEFADYAQNQWGEYRRIKAWRMDGGTEYAPDQFNEMCNDLGQRIEISTPYAPWQNGRAERSIRTVIEKVRKIMIDMQIPSQLWTHIFSACIHISNRTANSTLKGITPLEAFLDQVDPDFKDYQYHKPNLSYFRVLGCRAYVLIPGEKRTRSEKLNPRAELGILIGYEGENIYKIWVPSRKGDKLVRSSNVRFDESKNYAPYHQNRGDRLSLEYQDQYLDSDEYFDEIQQIASETKIQNQHIDESEQTADSENLDRIQNSPAETHNEVDGPQYDNQSQTLELE